MQIYVSDINLAFKLILVVIGSTIFSGIPLIILTSETAAKTENKAINTVQEFAFYVTNCASQIDSSCSYSTR